MNTPQGAIKPAKPGPRTTPTWATASTLLRKQIMIDEQKTLHLAYHTISRHDQGHLSNSFLMLQNRVSTKVLNPHQLQGLYACKVM